MEEKLKEGIPGIFLNGRNKKQKEARVQPDYEKGQSHDSINRLLHRLPADAASLRACLESRDRSEKV